MKNCSICPLLHGASHSTSHCGCKHFIQELIILHLIYRKTVYICPRIQPGPHIVLFILYKYYIVLSQNQDMASWGTFYKYSLTGYTAFRVLCEFTWLTRSKSLCVSAALKDDLCAPASLWFDLTRRRAFFPFKSASMSKVCEEQEMWEQGEVLHEGTCHETIRRVLQRSGILW